MRYILPIPDARAGTAWNDWAIQGAIWRRDNPNATINEIATFVSEFCGESHPVRRNSRQQAQSDAVHDGMRREPELLDTEATVTIGALSLFDQMVAALREQLNLSVKLVHITPLNEYDKPEWRSIRLYEVMARSADLLAKVEGKSDD